MGTQEEMKDDAKKKERASKRLTKELKKAQTSPPDFVTSIGLVDKDLFVWNIKVKGPDVDAKGEATPYAKGKFELIFDLKDEYPFKPPNIKENGEICHNLLKEGWSPQTQIHEALNKVYNMLANPDAEHPLDGRESVAEQLSKKPKDFFSNASSWTK